MRYQNRRLYRRLQWGQTGISVVVCLLVESSHGGPRRLLRGYICPGLSQSEMMKIIWIINTNVLKIVTATGNTNVYLSK